MNGTLAAGLLQEPERRGGDQPRAAAHQDDHRQLVVGALDQGVLAVADRGARADPWVGATDLLHEDGLAGSFGSLLLAHCVVCLPYAVRTLTAGLQGMDENLVHAAMSLGPAPLAVFRTITLPLLKAA